MLTQRAYSCVPWPRVLAALAGAKVEVTVSVVPAFSVLRFPELERSKGSLAKQERLFKTAHIYKGIALSSWVLKWTALFASATARSLIE